MMKRGQLMSGVDVETYLAELQKEQKEIKPGTLFRIYDNYLEEESFYILCQIDGTNNKLAYNLICLESGNRYTANYSDKRELLDYVVSDPDISLSVVSWRDIFFSLFN